MLVHLPKSVMKDISTCLGPWFSSVRRSMVRRKRALPSEPKSDMVVFLDMDETLIYNCENTKNERMGKATPEECEVVFECERSHSGWCTVFKRPHVDFFLQQLSSRYSRIYVFTAAGQAYADPILDQLDPKGTIFSGRFFRDSCLEIIHPCKFVTNNLYKDISILNMEPAIDPKRYVFLDDNWVYTWMDPMNTIPISPFNNPGNTNDKGLIRALDLIRLLDDLQDVRPALDVIFECSARKTLQACNIWIDPIPVDYL